jgi:hypothetical protein
MSTDLKTSLLVNRQVPEYVRDEYPTFVAFLEAYYEFLETKQGTQKNDLVTEAKKLRTISDVDDSVEEFEQSFYNTYGSLIPLEVQADKALLFKHLLPLYRTKGSENSFKLLFRLVFGEDIDIILPRNNVLKASNSKWVVDNKLRINTDIYSNFVGNGTTKEFILAQIVTADQVLVYVNDVLQTDTFFVRKEYRKLIFNTAPANGSRIKVVYDFFDEKLLENRKVTGLTSGASAIIEASSRRIISDVLNIGLPIELLINADSLEGSFLNGEFVTIPIVDANGVLLDIRASTFSVVKRINIIENGFNYNVGDPVIVTGGNSTTNAIATVESTFSGAINRVLVFHGGATFTNGSSILISANGNAAFTIVVDGIDQSGTNAANTFIVNTDIVDDYKNKLISDADYNFPNANNPTGENVATRIIDSLSFDTLQVGPITNVKILSADVSSFTPILDGFGATYGPSASLRTAKSLGTIARFKINNGGLAYAVGDEIAFGQNPPGTYGQRAAAVVSKVAANGYIQKIEVANTRISGTATISTSGVSVTGVGTKFTTELKVGDTIDINNESRVVATITDPVTMSVTTPWTYAATNKKIGVFNYYPQGGFGYVQNNFPTITVSSSGGAGANLEIDAIASDNEQLQGTALDVPGAILSIKVLIPGSGYEFIPVATAIGGSGTAILRPEIERSYLSAPGRWTTSDSLLSTPERKIAGREYYVDYSYVISSKIEFYKYKKMLKDLLHPVGFVNYAEYQKSNAFNGAVITAETVKDVTISGRVNVSNGSVVVSGQFTKFNIANQNNILTPGTRIAVNGEIRTVNSIISNTRLLTSANITEILIANTGSGYSNGYLNIANGGGRITSLTISYPGSGYSNGILTFSYADEAIPAVANVEVYPSNGALRTVTLTSGGLYSNTPIAMPDSQPSNVIYANTITITNGGAGYSNGYLVFADGDPLRVANVKIEVFDSNGAIRTITDSNVIDSGLYRGPSFPTVTPNSNSSIVIFKVDVTSNGLGHSNGVLTFSGGSATRAAQVAVEVYANGAIRRTTILDSGLYVALPTASPPTATLNTTPVHLSTIASNTATHNGRAIANGYIVFTSGNPVINANASYEVYPSNGAIKSITINQVGLYRTAPNVAVDSVPYSITEVYPTEGGSGYANGFIVIQGGMPMYNGNTGIANNDTYANPGYPTTNANVQIIVNTTGAIVRTIIRDVGLYANVSNINLNGGISSITVNTGARAVNSFITFSTPGTYGNTRATVNVANARIYVNTEGYILNVAVLANGIYYGTPTVTDLKYYENTASVPAGTSNAAYTITMGASTIYANGVGQNGSGAIFRIGYAANTLNTANIAATMTSNTLYTATISLTANSNSVTNAAFTVYPVSNVQTQANITVGFTGQNTPGNVSVEVYPANGAIRNLTINTEGNYYYPADLVPDSAGTGADLRINSKGIFTQTANNQALAILERDPVAFTTEDSNYIITTEDGNVILLES